MHTPPLPHAGMHTSPAQTPFAQPIPFMHSLLQAPQFRGSVSRLTSQPSAAFPSQSANPWLHETSTHWLFLQPGVPLGASQMLPQAPQLLRSLVVAASQPLPPKPSQSEK